MERQMDGERQRERQSRRSILKASSSWRSLDIRVQAPVREEILLSCIHGMHGTASTEHNISERERHLKEWTMRAEGNE